MTTLAMPSPGAVRPFQDAPAQERRRDLPARQSCLACQNPTNERKPYCIDHIDRMDYPARIIAEREAQDVERLSAIRPNGWKKIDPDGQTARDVVRLLFLKGVLTRRRIGTDLMLTGAEVAGYVIALEHAKLVRAVDLPSRRGGILRVVSLLWRGEQKVNYLR